MVTPTTTFRLTDRERNQVDRLANELVCSRSDVLRHGMAALRDDSALRKQIKADNLARAFLRSLRTQYGENAVIELIDGPHDPQWRLADAPLDPRVLSATMKRQGDRWVMDLVDSATGVAIHNVQSWEDGEGARHVVVRLRDLWVYSSYGVIGELKARQLLDGRTVVQIEEDDGSIRHLVLDHEGSSARLAPGDVPAAAFTDARPSVGIGIRRESEDGPHLGQGFGGKWELTGKLHDDRAAVVEILQQLIRRIRRGDLDCVLAVDSAPAAETGHA